MPKILFISQYFLPDIKAVSFRIYETASLLREKGFDIQVLTSKPHRDSIKNYKWKESEFSVIRAPAFGVKKNNKISYIFHYLSFSVMAIFYGVFKTRRCFDFIIATVPSPLTGIVGIILTKLKKSKFVLDIRDIWPDSIVATGKTKEKSMVYKLEKMLEKFIYRRADLITCVSQDMADHILSQTKGKKLVSVIYNGFDEKLINRIKKIEISQYFSKNLPIVTHAGNIGNAQNIKLLIEAARHFEGKINFLLIGGGILKNDMEKMVQKLELENIIFKGPVSRELVLSIESASWALFLNVRKFDVFSKTIPSKIFEYLFAQKPIIFGLEGEAKKILTQTGGNLYFQPDDLASLIETIEKLYRNYFSFARKALLNRKLVLTDYTRQKATEKLAKTLNNLSH